MTPTCDRAGVPCPAEGCPGRTDPAACRTVKALAAWNRLTRDQQIAAYGHMPPPPSPALLAAVANCPDRGPVLPVPLQADCGCGGELSECRAGKGAVAGRVTTRDCLACRRQATGLT